MYLLKIVAFCILSSCKGNDAPQFDHDFQAAIEKAKTSGLMEMGQAQKGLPWFIKKVFDPVWQPSNNTIVLPDFKLTNQDNKLISKRDIAGKVVLANFFFVGCGGMCPTIMARIQKLHKKIGMHPDVAFISHTLTPELDSPKDLKTYQKRMAIDASNWHLLTGDKGQIYQLARQNYYADGSEGDSIAANNFRHSEHLYLFDRKGFLRGIYNSKNPMAMKQAVVDFEKLYY